MKLFVLTNIFRLFQVTQFQMYTFKRNEIINILDERADWKRRIITKVADEYRWSKSGGWTVMLWPIQFHYVGVWVSAGLPYVYIYIWQYLSPVPTYAMFSGR
jgi:hypothetical protein